MQGKACLLIILLHMHQAACMLLPCWCGSPAPVAPPRALHMPPHRLAAQVLAASDAPAMPLSPVQGDADSANGQTGQILAGSSDDESADVWYECYNTLSRSSSAAPGRATGDPAPAPGPHKTGANASLPPGAGLLAAPSDGAPTGKQQQQQQVRGVPDGAAAEASTSGRCCTGLIRHPIPHAHVYASLVAPL